MEREREGSGGREGGKEGIMPCTTITCPKHEYTNTCTLTPTHLCTHISLHPPRHLCTHISLPPPPTHTHTHTIWGLQSDVCIVFPKVLFLLSSNRCSDISKDFKPFHILDFTLPMLIIEAVEGPFGENE